MDDLDQVVRELAEKAAIEQVLLRYASAIDIKDFPTLRTLFCDDITARYGEVAVAGGDELIKWIDGMTVDNSWQHHYLNVYHVDLVSDVEATALTYHTSHQTKTETPNRCTKIVARYHDRLRKIDGSWKIADKYMEIGWVEETEAEQAPAG